MSKRKIKKKIKKRRPRAGHAKKADAQNRAAGAAFQRWAMTQPARDRAAVEQVEKANRRIRVEEYLEKLAQARAEGGDPSTLDEMSDEFDERKYREVKENG